MTQEEFLIRQRKALNSIVKFNNPLRLAARTAHKDMAVRIFEDGKNSSDGNIGQYDTKRPLYVYVNPNTAPRAGALKAKGIEGLKPTKGKTGEHTFKNGKEHKTTYVKNYKEFRNRIGRRIDKVNLVLSGDLQSDFSNGKVKNPSPQKVNVNEYIVILKREINQDKREGLENKYGTIFAHTKNEIAKFKKIAELELRNELSKAGL